MSSAVRQILHVRLHGPGETRYAQLLALCAEITPLVQALPPDAADLDVSGALTYFGQDAEELAHVILLRAAARHDATVSIGAAGNRMLAAAASAQRPGSVTCVGLASAEVDAFWRPQPVRILPGIGAATAVQLDRFGLRTVGALADAPLPTVQRILGKQAGRLIHERAHGIDPRPVTVSAPAETCAAAHRFERDELDPARQRTTLFALADQLGARLRAEHRLCGRLTLAVGYADASSTTKRAGFARPTARTADLAHLAARMHRALALQRARVRVLSLRAGDLVGADTTPHQLSLDPVDTRYEQAEHAADRACARFGRGAVTRGARSPG